MDEVISQAALPEAPWGAPYFRRLPGTVAVGPDDWLMTDDAYGAQMALRERLLARHAADIVIAPDGTGAACGAALDAVLDLLARRAGYRVGAEAVDCPDGRRVAVDRGRPLATLARLIQEDVCILERGDGAEHRLVAGVVAFPLGWRLAEKIGQPLTGVHGRIEHYDDAIAARVQRMMDGLRPGHPVMRCNFFEAVTPELFAPTPQPGARHESAYVRSERQCLVKLPDGPVLFTIHTSIVPKSAVPEDLRAAP